jgi:DNA helicase-2/ATP-dependent DNA helicase PcrA
MKYDAQEKAINQVEEPCVIKAGAGTGKTYTIKKKIRYLLESNIITKEDNILCLTFSNEATNSLESKIRDELTNTNFSLENIHISTFHSFCFDILKEDGNLIDLSNDIELLLPEDSKILLHKDLKQSTYNANRYISTISKAKDYGIDLKDYNKYLKELETKIKDYTSLEELEKFTNNQKLRLNNVIIELTRADKDTKKALNQEKKYLRKYFELYKDYIKYRDLVDIWSKYELLKKENNLVDYSDLNNLVLKLFLYFGSEKYLSRYNYVFIDEFQDTNKLQYELIKYIAKHKNITIVGDPNQSIYAFRGAYKDNFDHFIKDFNIKKENIFKLDKSYRCSNKILDIAYRLIKHNIKEEKQNEELIYLKNANNIEGDQVKVIELSDEYEEARYIADQILRKIEEGVSLKDIAVFIRTHKQSEVIKKELSLKKIPFIYSGDINLLQFSEIKTTIAYLSLLSNILENNGTGQQAWWYLFNYENKISYKDLLKIGKHLKKHRNENLRIDTLLFDNNLDLSSNTKQIIDKISKRIDYLVKISNRSLPKLILEIYNLTGLSRAYSLKRTPENIEHLLNLKTFYDIVNNYSKKYDDNILNFTKYLEILNKLDINIDSNQTQNVNAVKLMTMHASKGLEFKVVFVSNLAKNRFPIHRTSHEPIIPKEFVPDVKLVIDKFKEDNKDLLETKPNKYYKALKKKITDYEKKSFRKEERKLAYVAFTRAIDNLYLTYAKEYSNKKEPNSIFLDEINYKNKKEDQDLKEEDQEQEDLKENNNIEFIEDQDIKSTIIAPNSKLEKYKVDLKNRIIRSLDSDNTKDVLHNFTQYLLLKNKDIDLKDLQEQINNYKLDSNNLELLRKKYIENKPELVFDPQKIQFSPSSLSTYLECPKKFELRHLFSMPELRDFEEAEDFGTSPLDLGSFVHKILEVGVEENRYEYNDLLDILNEQIQTKDFKNKILKEDLDKVKYLLRIFVDRNYSKLKSAKQVKTEHKLKLKLDKYIFNGVADRLDINEDGSIDIIDYKTNKEDLKPQKREVQLGLYALALQDEGYKVNKLILDTLKLEKSTVMQLDPKTNIVKGIEQSSRINSFNLEELKQKIIKICKNVENDFQNGFSCIKDPHDCKFCGYKFYCPKWKN